MNKTSVLASSEDFESVKFAGVKTKIIYNRDSIELPKGKKCC